MNDDEPIRLDIVNQEYVKRSDVSDEEWESIGDRNRRIVGPSE